MHAPDQRHFHGRQRPVALALLTTLALLAAATAAFAKTFAAPHVFEQKGRISNTPYTFDTTMFAQYNGGVACVGSPPGGATVDLYLYDNTGAPMRGAGGGDVCNPCSASIGGTHRSQGFSLEELLDNAGGFQGVKAGFALIVVAGDSGDEVSLQALIVNAHTGPFDLAAFGFNPTEVNAPGKAGAGAAALPCGRVFTANNLLAVPAPAPTPYSYDTTIYATYTGGLAGSPYGGGATVDYYLFDESTGEPFSGADGLPVCAPCSVTLDDTHRKDAFRLGGALPGGAIISAAVSAVCVVGGDAGNVALLPVTVNQHSGATDVSLSGAPMREVTATAATSVPAELAERLGLRNYPNPFNPLTTFAYSLPQAGSVQVRVFDAHGALVRTLVSDAQSAGDHEVAWDGLGDDGRRAPSGVYFGRIESAGVSDVRKVLLLK